MIQPVRHNASFRDPAGYIFLDAGRLLRRIQGKGIPEYQQLMKSGLYDQLTNNGFLINHAEVTEQYRDHIDGIIIQPDYVPHISYPYEWCFSALQDAALLTLDVCTTAIDHGMILKDASAYNIQFYRGEPVFIDTGSFQSYEEGTAWSGYRQFCQHFLAPLLLASRIDIQFIRALELWIDGIPLELASRLLPVRSWLSWKTLTNIHLHARAQQKYSDSESEPKKRNAPKVSKNGLLGIIDSLRTLIRNLSWKPQGTEWGDYYSFTNYSDASAEEKRRLIQELTAEVGAETVWDLGGNVGVYSRASAEAGASVVCWDIDPAAVERNYRHMKDRGEIKLLPLVQDLTNPSKSLGWAHAERDSLQQRGPVDLVLGLALIHHLAISNNVPLSKVADYFSTLSRYLVIEFVPKEDSQVKKLLSTREDIFPEYHLEGFIQAFDPYFVERKRHTITDTHRTLFLLQTRTEELG